MKRLLILLMLLCLMLTGCAGDSAPAESGTGREPDASGAADETAAPSEPPGPDEPDSPAESEPRPYEGNETGNAELDAQVLALLDELYVPDAGEMLAAVYDWVCNEITYRAGTTDVSGGFTDELTQELALDGLLKRKGNCDTEAALMAVLLSRLGYSCEIVQGQFLRDDGQWVDHAWVIAQVDGAEYHFDPLYGRYYAGGDPRAYFMQPAAALEPTHTWEQSAASQ